MEKENIQEIRPSLDAGTALCEHIQNTGFRGHLFSDIIVAFKGKEYPLHKIILSQSHYFYSLLSGPWKESGLDRIEMQIDDPMVTSEGLESAFAFMYGVIPTFTADNVVSILAAGSFLGLENLSESSLRFALNDLKVGTFAKYNDLAEKHCYGRFAKRLHDACWSILCTHASRELLHHLPKLPLEVLCHLLKSDELWVLNEADRYKLAKQALIDWKLAQVEAAGEKETSFPEELRRKRSKSMCSRKAGTSGVVVPRMSRTRTGERGSRLLVKNRQSKRKEVCVLQMESRHAVDIVKEREEQDLKRLRRLWETDAVGLELCTELFTEGGIIFAHLKVNEILQVKRELEDANLSSDVANNSIWHQVLLNEYLSKLDHSPSEAKTPSYTDEEEEDDIDDEEEDDEDEDDDEDLSEQDSSDSDRWSTDNGEDSNSSNGRDGECPYKEKKLPNSFLVSFMSDNKGVENLDPGMRRTTGGFTWSAKPGYGMHLENFPPFRFGIEFDFNDKIWRNHLDWKSQGVPYGGALWRIEIFADVLPCDHMLCKLTSMPKDVGKEMQYRAKVFTNTLLGLRCAAGVGVSARSLSARENIGMVLAMCDLVKDEPLRVSAVVQLIDDDVV
ncbi:hypothetical protein KP509_11G092600 [Ceratopteris richardii]|uniref:BTB domain-containing protein n=1 Tax=Ceratopteris richardii TaxID=49495 RepID=A0A8T2TVF6_CERRI|nr:hypothetical protein KP509_11G092600 [Ceratopteris richardii]